ncbi:hypothetical protein GCM10011512_15560 [Tersicoccus solisilvae]|uniref:Uncharacterized protein n=1 Tax=Tersicoccus solisilvae TaxID=1882339 RepID=A0ABQ1P5V7_9MICC|nr:hypothetical protein [Tersicoccus solisilvae]GGC89503.1 hypothetical protein GCM10011512_15560 [Tersicoccus solisilvae]
MYVIRQTTGDKLGDVAELARQLRDAAVLAGPQDEQAAAVCAAVGAELDAILTNRRDQDPVFEVTTVPGLGTGTRG